MSKPWSQAGLAEDWAALARNWAIALVLGLLGVWVAGFRCARYLERPDPAVAAEATHERALRDSLATERVRADSLAVVLVVAQAHVAVDSARAAVTHDIANRKSAGITVDTSRHFLPIARDTGSRSAADSAAADTVSYAAIQRPVDAKPFLVPRYFAEAYLAKVNEASAYHDLAASEHVLNRAHMARETLDSTRLEVSDSLNASLARQVDALNKARHPLCGAKCGAAITLGALALAGYGLHAVGVK